MQDRVAGALAGLAAGTLVSVVMAVGREKEMLNQTLAERADDWLDERFHTRSRIGDVGTTVLEQANHFLSSLVFGTAYGALRARGRRLPVPVVGALYGVALYVLNLGGIAPLIGLTRGEWNEPRSQQLQRFCMHFLYAITTAAAFEFLNRRQRR